MIKIGGEEEGASTLNLQGVQTYMLPVIHICTMDWYNEKLVRNCTLGYRNQLRVRPLLLKLYWRGGEWEVAIT